MSTSSTAILRFDPIFQTRVWGGRLLEEQLGKTLPDPTSPFGESWEISAREEADSTVASGPLKGKTLTELWQDPVLKEKLFGPRSPKVERFPLLCKILDAKDKLSIQVHPPAGVAERLGGEPKTEVWYIAHAEPGAELYVGVKPGVTEGSFHTALEKGTAERLVHAIPVKTGQHIFIPSGRLHAIGAGLLIYEIQQNSDTTYRVYDWNRTGLDGKPRDLHISESLQCIDFDDVEPKMDQAKWALLAECEHFRLEKHRVAPGHSLCDATERRFSIVTVVSGELSRDGETFQRGDFFIVTFGSNGELPLAGSEGAEVLLTAWP
jgi:mannose-6-phosphate isomerase